MGREARVGSLVGSLGDTISPPRIGALPVAVARACGHRVAYLPGLAKRRIADLHRRWTFGRRAATVGG